MEKKQKKRLLSLNKNKKILRNKNNWKRIKLENNKIKNLWKRKESWKKKKELKIKNNKLKILNLEKLKN